MGLIEKDAKEKQIHLLAKVAQGDAAAAAMLSRSERFHASVPTRAFRLAPSMGDPSGDKTYLTLKPGEMACCRESWKAFRTLTLTLTLALTLTRIGETSCWGAFLSPVHALSCLSAPALEPLQPMGIYIYIHIHTHTYIYVTR